MLTALKGADRMLRENTAEGGGRSPARGCDLDTETPPWGEKERSVAGNGSA